MRGQVGHKTRPHAQLPSSCMGMDDLTTDSPATWVIDVLGLLFDIKHRCLYNQALANVRSTGAGIKCLYCIEFITFQSLYYVYFIQCYQNQKEQHCSLYNNANFHTMGRKNVLFMISLVWGALGFFFAILIVHRYVVCPNLSLQLTLWLPILFQVKSNR